MPEQPEHNNTDTDSPDASPDTKYWNDDDIEATFAAYMDALDVKANLDKAIAGLKADIKAIAKSRHCDDWDGDTWGFKGSITIKLGKTSRLSKDDLIAYALTELKLKPSDIATMIEESTTQTPYTKVDYTKPKKQKSEVPGL